LEEAKSIERLNAESVDIKRRLERLEENDQRHEEDIRKLYGVQEGTKAYVTQILQRFDQLENKLFALITQLQGSTTAERKDWKELIKYVIGATAGLVFYHLVVKGG
jgi:predicted nuclease with TOPRIM domain